MKRSSGILLPIFSLPSPYGIGTLGKAAYEFTDFLAASGQSWWQLLPVGPTSYGDSPYQSFSTYAGNPYFIDLDMLCEDKLLTKREIKAVDWGNDPARVDYEKQYKSRFLLLEKAAARGWERDIAEVETFERENFWVADYALYMALKRHFGMKAWIDWPDADIRQRKPGAIEKYRERLSKDVRLFTYIQYLFFKQWDALRAYAAKQGIGLIGDLPIYVAMDSADVWADPKQFQLDENNTPTAVAGVPPDYFSADGQLWGNPLYDWEEMEKDGYGWWIRRIAGAQKLYDMIRIDHFRGLESYWAVPYGEQTARNGKWVKGPGLDFVRRIMGWFPKMQFIAEDLGILTPEVHELLSQSGLPGMKILEFAFSTDALSDYLPHRYPANCVCYTGTHDNAPIMAWKEEAKASEVEFARQYLGLNETEGFHWGMIRGGMSSAADLFVLQMQDCFALGAEARMNTPGVLGGNWQWRLCPGQITDTLAKKLKIMTLLYERSH